MTFAVLYLLVRVGKAFASQDPVIAPVRFRNGVISFVFILGGEDVWVL